MQAAMDTSMSTYRKQLEEWLKKLDVKAERVLDVGGAQLPVDGRVNSFDVQDYLILDLPQPHEMKGSVDLKWDINIPLPADLQVQPFDTVFCLEVMEYIWNPVVALANLAALTHPGGRLYISFPYFYPPHEPYEQDALRYTLRGAMKILTVTGFELELVDWRLSEGDDMASAIRRNGLRLSRKASVNEHRALGFIITAKRI